MTEHEKWEAGLWYDANYAPEICAEREKAEELYTAFNQTRPSEKAKRAELLHRLARVFRENREEMAGHVTAEMGMLYGESLGDIEFIDRFSQIKVIFKFILHLYFANLITRCT